MAAIYHLRIKKDYATTVIEDLCKNGAVEFMSEEKAYVVPQWQIDQMRESVKYYKLHPEELINWDDTWKMIKTE